MNIKNNNQFSGNRNDDIEILRGIAITLVLTAHVLAYCSLHSVTETTSKLFSFWGGVDLFFAISGYVIAASLLRQEEKYSSTPEKIGGLVSFWIRRVWRLWPAAWFWLAVPFIISCLTFPELNNPQNMRAVLAGLIGGILNIINIQQWRYHSGFGMPNLLWSQYWSLSLEQQFYLVSAPMVLFMKRRHLTLAMFLVIAGQFFLVRPANAANLWWFIRSDAFAWGILIAILMSTPSYKVLVEPTLLSRWWAALITLAIGLIGLTATQLLYSLPFDVGLMAVVSGLLVFVASYDKGYLGIHGIIGQFFSWLGDRSYAVYLIHGFVIVFLLRVGPLSHLDRGNPISDVEITGAVLSVTLVLAELTYRFIEVPARIYGRDLSRKYQEKISSIIG